MRLSDLTGENGEFSKIEITGLACDSRAVEPGYLFAALAGSRLDGRSFIPEALNRGAAAILTEPGAEADFGKAARLEDRNPRRRLARIAAAYYGRQPETVAAITGTNGKTSVASFTRQLWQRLGHKAASVGTLGIESDDIAQSTGLTTPDCLRLHQALSDMADAGIDCVAIEASSHGLAQYRLDGVRISVGAFTNLTRDHLDYHLDTEEYYLAKARLFGELLAPGAAAVINVDDDAGRALEDLVWSRGLKLISVGRRGREFAIADITPDGDGQTFTLRHADKDYALRLPLIGDFQVENAVLAAAIVIASGGEAEDVFGALERLEGVPGRLELAGTAPESGARIYVDYAHTPNALERLLRTVRPYCAGRIRIVFGCGGDRDAGKREPMGRIAAELADVQYVTDDNPRSEDPAAIRAEILAACPEAQEFDDRSAAIRHAIAALEPGDILLVTGKGHEQGQDIGGEVRPHSDFDEITAALAAHGDKAGGGDAL